MINQRKDSKTYTSQLIEDETHLFLFHCHFIVNSEIIYYSKFDKHQSIIFHAVQCKTPQV